jgi:capsular polysaccharide transport system permease protein
MSRIVKKLKQSPVKFVADSNAYVTAQQAMLLTRAKLGSFVLVIFTLSIVVVYYTLIASPRFISETKFIIKQAGSPQLALTGLVALGSSSSSTKDALILKEYIQSRAMALSLNKSLLLKKHYQQEDWDWFSRLGPDTSTEDYIEYFQKHINVQYDELSEVLSVELQTFQPEFSLKVTKEILKLSETFINRLGDKIVQQQMKYAQKEVDRSYGILKQHKLTLLNFQQKYQLYDPKQQGFALATAINQLEVDIIKQETELKSLLAFMKKDSAEVKSKQIILAALNAQLSEEKEKITNTGQQSINKIKMEFEEISLTALLATDLYQSSLAAMEQARVEVYSSLKYILIITNPSLAEDSEYPRRLYSILTWFISILLVYAIGRLIISIIKEHQE